jgi:hypothetical protein
VALTALLQTVRDLVRPQLPLSGAILLQEEDPGSTIRPFKLETSQPALVVRLDQVPCEGMSVDDRLFPLFNRSISGLCIHCDYVIFRQSRATSDAPLYVLLVELKSGPLGDAQKQIENTRLLMDWMLATMRRYKKSAPWTDDVRYRGLIFTSSARPVAGDPKRVPCPYDATSTAMPDVLFVRHPPCAGYQLDWFCSDMPPRRG